MYCDSSNGILKIKSVQVNFVVDTVVTYYCIYYEIYLNSLYLFLNSSRFVKELGEDNK